MRTPGAAPPQQPASGASATVTASPQAPVTSPWSSQFASSPGLTGSGSTPRTASRSAGSSWTAASKVAAVPAAR
ncbi:hypothetical protein [Modestobacter italicus]|uniref:hypothetical protein n=1 Tax=Modestobacter italicus (strain DSM 44449 / CECT 9708 / BC 501) TaxID=2732864 RepID=UPI0005A1E094|nr:hypothetical protein [Modestobacter marinus]